MEVDKPEKKKSNLWKLITEKLLRWFEMESKVYTGFYGGGGGPYIWPNKQF